MRITRINDTDILQSPRLRNIQLHGQCRSSRKEATKRAARTVRSAARTVRSAARTVPAGNQTVLNSNKLENAVVSST